MRFQPKYVPYAGSPLFPDGAADRPLVPGTVPRTPTAWEVDAAGQVPPQPPTTAELLARGQERFNIYCSMCHGRDGYGRGMVVMRGYPAPPNLHEAEVRKLDDRVYYTVITGGLGKMPPYAQQVPPEDRWAVVAYIRALQLSQDAPAADVPEGERGRTPVAPELPKGPMRQP
jgi:mono/diheme cytochrome c family protein